MRRRHLVRQRMEGKGALNLWMQGQVLQPSLHTLQGRILHLPMERFSRTHGVSRSRDFGQGLWSHSIEGIRTIRIVDDLFQMRL